MFPVDDDDAVFEGALHTCSRKRKLKSWNLKDRTAICRGIGGAKTKSRKVTEGELAAALERPSVIHFFFKIMICCGRINEENHSIEIPSFSFLKEVQSTPSSFWNHCERRLWIFWDYGSDPLFCLNHF